MIPTTTMQLPKPETGDQMEPFFLGTQPDGGYWMTVTRLSEHDHTGGLLGKPITAATIPDGSITTSKLDPSVLAPYSLVDGSKPFTGQVTMQADAIIRDALFFGPQGSAAAPDVTLTRTAAGVLGLSGALSSASGTLGRLAIGATGTVTVTPDAGLPSLVAQGVTNNIIQYGSSGTIWQTYTDTNGFQLFQGGKGNRLAVSPTGTLTLTPDAGQASLLAGGGGGASLSVGPGTLSPAVGLQSTGGGALQLHSVSGAVTPFLDNTTALGNASIRWAVIYSNVGAINTSAAAAKTDITPLDPAAALAAVLATDPVTFTYTAPAPTAEQYELPDDPEQAEQVLHQRLVNGPLQEAARTQAGFVLHDETGGYQTDPLFETGFGQSNSANTAGILLAALHEITRRLEALEGA